jgi:PDZ domain
MNAPVREKGFDKRLILQTEQKQFSSQRYSRTYQSPRESIGSPQYASTTTDNNIDVSSPSQRLPFSANRASPPTSPASSTASPSAGGRIQPLHYRTNFGKDYGYRPPSPASPVSSPTLLTQWSSQQNLQRKKQQLLQRQKQILNPESVVNSPHLRYNEDGTLESQQDFDRKDGKTHATEDLPFDEKDPLQKRVKSFRNGIASPDSSPQRARLMFERGTIVDNAECYNDKTPRLSRYLKSLQDSKMANNSEKLMPSNIRSISGMSPSKSVTSYSSPTVTFGKLANNSDKLMPSTIRNQNWESPSKSNTSYGTQARIGGNLDNNSDTLMQSSNRNNHGGSPSLSQTSYDNHVGVFGVASPQVVGSPGKASIHVNDRIDASNVEEISTTTSGQSLNGNGQQIESLPGMNYKVPLALHVLYSSPVRLSSPKESLSPFMVNQDDLASPVINLSSSSGTITAQQVTTPQSDNYSNTSSKARSLDDGQNEDDNNDSSNNDYQEIPYEDAEMALNMRNLLQRYQLPRPRVSGPTFLPLTDVEVCIDHKQYSVIGGANVLSDEASALTGDLTMDDNKSVDSPKNRDFHPAKIDRGASIASPIGSESRARSPNRFNWKNYENLSAIYKISPKNTQTISKQHPYHRAQSAQISVASTATSVSSDNKSDSLPMIGVVGVSRYLQVMNNESKIQNRKLDNSLPSSRRILPTVDSLSKHGATPPYVEGSISIKSEEDSLFDFIDSSATTSTNEFESIIKPTTDPISPPTVSVLKLPDISTNYEPQYVMQQRPHQNIYANRLVSILHESTTDDDTSIDKYDATVSIDQISTEEERTRIAWARRKRLGAEKRFKATSSPTGMIPLDPLITASESGGPQEKNITMTSQADVNLSESLSPRQRRVENLQKRNEQHKETMKYVSNSLAEFRNGDGTMQTEQSEIFNDGATINSFYTKSAESEFVDAIKDILIVGDGESTAPGRKRHNKTVRQIDADGYSESQADDNIALKEEDEASQITGPIPLKADGAGLSLRHLKFDNEQDELDFQAEWHEFSQENRSRPVSPAKSLVANQQGDSNPSPRQSPSLRQPAIVSEEKKDDDGFIGDVWNYVGSSIIAVTAALGLDNATNDVRKETNPVSPGTATGTISATATPRSAGTAFSSIGKVEPLVLPPGPHQTDTLSNSYTTEESKYQQTGHQLSSNPQDNKQGVLKGWNILDYASDVFLGPLPVAQCTSPNKQTANYKEPTVTAIRATGTKGADDSFSIEQSLTDEESRFREMAVQAAISLHRINGFEFDRAHPIDMSHDIKFIVVDLTLPLGLIFQENDSGCWITTVLPDGSAAATNAVEPGDQLASVDGINAMDMTVDEIAYLVRQHKGETVELTLLRYVGRFRPHAGSMIDEEGYEIMAKQSEQSLPPVVLPRNKLEEERDESAIAPRHRHIDTNDDTASRSCMSIFQNLSPTKNRSHASKNKGENSITEDSSNNKQTALLSPFRRSKKGSKDDNSVLFQSNSSNNSSGVEKRAVSSLSPRKKRSFVLFGKKDKKDAAAS